MPRKIRRAMVLAAGYGTRLKPLTDRTPKPLVPVAGKPMLEYALEKLAAYGVEEVVINVSHLKQQLLAHATNYRGLNIQVSEESEPLETGGGLRKALPLLGTEPFFTINSDILWFDERESALARLAQHWQDARMDILLLTQPRAKAVGYDQGEDHLFAKPETTLEWDDHAAPYIIAGVSILHPRILSNAPEGKFSVKVLWREALDKGRLACLPHHGLWFQTGTLPDIEKAEEFLRSTGAEALR